MIKVKKEGRKEGRKEWRVDQARNKGIKVMKERKVRGREGRKEGDGMWTRWTRRC